MRMLLTLAVMAGLGSTALAQDLLGQARDACFKEEQVKIQAVHDKMKELGVQHPEDAGQPYESFRYWEINDGRAKCIEARIARQGSE